MNDLRAAGVLIGGVIVFVLLSATGHPYFMLVLLAFIICWFFWVGWGRY